MEDNPVTTYYELSDLGNYIDFVDLSQAPFKLKEEWFIKNDGSNHIVDPFGLLYIPQDKIYHRLDSPSGLSLPAEIEYFPDGCLSLEKYYKKGIVHRDNDEPAIIHYYNNGNKFSEKWIINSQEYRDEDKPSFIKYHRNGNKSCEVWFKYGEYCREFGPSWIYYYPNGNIKSESWYTGRYQHRLDGPTFIEYNEEEEIIEELYSIHGIEHSKEEFYRIINIVRQFITNIRKLQRNSLSIKLNKSLRICGRDVVNLVCSYGY